MRLCGDLRVCEKRLRKPGFGLGVVEAAGSNPVTQTNTDTVIDTIQSRYLYFIESFARRCEPAGT